MPESGIKIEPCSYVIAESEVGDVNMLMPLLYGKNPPALKKENLQMVLSHGEIVFAKAWTEDDAGVGFWVTVGMGSIVFVQKLRGTTAQIEDVAVKEGHQGQGIGRQIVNALLDEAKRRGVKQINLTSKPERLAANVLYQKLGFKQRNTNVYRLEL